MTYEQVQDFLTSQGIDEISARNVAIHLTRDDREPSNERVRLSLSKLRQPHPPREPRGMKILTTPEEDFGTGFNLLSTD